MSLFSIYNLTTDIQYPSMSNGDIVCARNVPLSTGARTALSRALSIDETVLICVSHYDIVTYQNSKFDQSLISENKDIGFACNRHLCEWLHIMCAAPMRLDYFVLVPFFLEKQRMAKNSYFV